MDHTVILRIDECLRTRCEARRRRELLDLCQHNPQLTGAQLFDAFRGHLDILRLGTLVSTWDTWRGLLSIGRPTEPLMVATSSSATRRARPAPSHRSPRARAWRQATSLAH